MKLSIEVKTNHRQLVFDTSRQNVATWGVAAERIDVAAYRRVDVTGERGEWRRIRAGAEVLGKLLVVCVPGEIQTCIVHLIRNSLSFCSWKDRKPVAAELKNI